MEHKSNIDGRTYIITESVELVDSSVKLEDITLIWIDNDGSGTPRKLINWYYGEYDFYLTEEWIRNYNLKTKNIHLPISYVHLLIQTVNAIMDHNLAGLMDTPWENSTTMAYLNEILQSVLYPLDEIDEDTTIVVDSAII